MANIEFTKAFTMPRDELRTELDQLAEQLGEKLQLNCEWLSDDCLDFRRSGAEGQINIGEDEIEFTVTLGMLMKVFRSTIEQEVQEFMEKHIY